MEREAPRPLNTVPVGNPYLPGGRLATRADRFAARLAGETLPDLVDLQRPPEWQALRGNDRARLGMMMAGLHCRPLIDAELNGVRLAALADMFGEDEFDAICGVDVTSLPQLPEARQGEFAPLLSDREAMASLGRDLLETAERQPVFGQLAYVAALITPTIMTERQVAA